MGKWVARKGDKIVAADLTLAKLRTKMRKERKDAEWLCYTFVQPGPGVTSVWYSNILVK